MAINNVLVQVEAVVSTSTTITLGYSPGQTVPTRYLVCEPTANTTVTLPLSTPALATSGGSNYIPGSGPGFPITIMNTSGTYTVTIAAASGDTLVNVPVLSAQYSSVDLFAVPSENKWYKNSSSSGSSAFGNFEIAANNLGSSSTSQTMFLADAAYKVTAFSETHGTASSAGGTMQIEKATGTQAIASGTNLLTGTLATSTTANTPQSGTLIATTATLTLAAGNRLNLILGGTLTSLANCSVVVTFTRL